MLLERSGLICISIVFVTIVLFYELNRPCNTNACTILSHVKSQRRFYSTCPCQFATPPSSPSLCALTEQHFPRIIPPTSSPPASCAQSRPIFPFFHLSPSPHSHPPQTFFHLPPSNTATPLPSAPFTAAAHRPLPTFPLPQSTHHRPSTSFRSHHPPLPFV